MSAKSLPVYKTAQQHLISNYNELKILNRALITLPACIPLYTDYDVRTFLTVLNYRETLQLDRQMWDHLVISVTQLNYQVRWEPHKLTTILRTVYESQCIDLISVSNVSKRYFIRDWTPVISHCVSILLLFNLSNQNKKL